MARILYADRGELRLLTGDYHGTKKPVDVNASAGFFLSRPCAVDRTAAMAVRADAGLVLSFIHKTAEHAEGHRLCPVQPEYRHSGGSGSDLQGAAGGRFGRGRCVGGRFVQVRERAVARFREPVAEAPSGFRLKPVL